jgi:hypothetical protein
MQHLDVFCPQQSLKPAASSEEIGDPTDLAPIPPGPVEIVKADRGIHPAPERTGTAQDDQVSVVPAMGQSSGDIHSQRFGPTGIQAFDKKSDAARANRCVHGAVAVSNRSTLK